MRYECSRCGAIENTTNPPHLCKNLKKRLERQTKAINAVIDILDAHFNLHFHDWGDSNIQEIRSGTAECLDPHCTTEIAQEIVKKISGMHLE